MWGKLGLCFGMRLGWVRVGRMSWREGWSDDKEVHKESISARVGTA